MEKALEWMDECIYLDKKVLVHCRLGHGRTGTFIAAYLLRRGFDFKLAEKTMKSRKAKPATYEQRSFLKNYGKQVGPLQTALPKIDNRPALDVSPLLQAYEQLIARLDAGMGDVERAVCCGRDQSECCQQPFDLLLIESMHFSQVINRNLKQEQRQVVIERAFDLARLLQKLHHRQPGLTTAALATCFPEEPLQCPLLEDGQCLVFAERPLRCRSWGSIYGETRTEEIVQAIAALSRQAYQTLTGRTPPAKDLQFSSADTISGKFVQLYFQAMTGEDG
jgi:hypothetical protein